MMTERLSYMHRAQLYTQLAALNRAGIAAGQSWRMLDLGEPWREPIAKVRRALERGMDLAAAGENAGILLPLDAAVIRATQLQGDLTPAFLRLSNYYQQRALQWQKIRARMLLPTIMLLLALVIKPLPELILGQISFLNYLFQVGRIPLLLVLAVKAGRKVLSWFQGSQLGTRAPVIDLILLHLPHFGTLHRRRCLADFWHALAMLLEAGSPILEAYPQALKLVNNRHLQQSLQPVLIAMEQGQTFTNSLVLCEIFRNDKLVRSFITSGEASGSLPEMLARLAAAEDETLALAQQQLSEWLPRLAYAVVALWIAYGLIQGGPPVSQVPV